MPVKSDVSLGKFFEAVRFTDSLHNREQQQRMLFKEIGKIDLGNAIVDYEHTQANLFLLFLLDGHKRKAMTAHSRITTTSRATTPMAAMAYMAYIKVLLSTLLGALVVLGLDI